jgi:hypothetical protein
MLFDDVDKNNNEIDYIVESLNRRLYSVYIDAVFGRSLSTEKPSFEIFKKNRALTANQSNLLIQETGKFDLDNLISVVFFMVNELELSKLKSKYIIQLANATYALGFLESYCQFLNTLQSHNEQLLKQIYQKYKKFFRREHFKEVHQKEYSFKSKHERLAVQLFVDICDKYPSDTPLVFRQVVSLVALELRNFLITSINELTVKQKAKVENKNMVLMPYSEELITKWIRGSDNLLVNAQLSRFPRLKQPAPKKTI